MRKINPKSETVLWVCFDCYLTTFGEVEEVDEAHIISAPVVAPGATYEALGCHHTDGTPGSAEEHADECEKRDFDTAPCANCGTHLAGTRYVASTYELLTEGSKS